ncbi:MAG: hypothetical protein GX126_17610 [Bacteroidales bacterium]|jgi:hypothetical protein|nr:hypothetical protein [Bacteroidales bacterium]
MKKGQFKPGQSGNPAGRPPKAINKISRPVKESVADFLTEKFEELPEIWQKLKPREQARLLIDLLPYVASKMQAVSLDANINFDALSETELDIIINKIFDNEKK